MFVTARLLLATLIFLALVLLLTGCGTPPPAAPATTAANDGSSAASETEHAAQAVAPETEQAELDLDAAAVLTLTEAEEIFASLAQPICKPQRLLLFTTDGPVRIDVRLWIDRQPFDLALEKLIDHVMQLADSNSDGQPTWEELADQPDIRSGQFGNLSFQDPKERTRLINQYDANRNGWVDRDEVPRLVTRNRGKSEAFSVRQTSYAADRSRADSPLRMWIDASGDGVISADEIATAGSRLRLRDLDDDEIVTLPELDTNSQMPMPGENNTDRRRFFGSPAMVTLDERTRWEETLFAMQQNYERGAPLDLARFSAGSLIQQLDTDADGKLTKQELAQVDQIDPLLVLDVRFGARDENQARISCQWMNQPDKETATDDDAVNISLGSDWLVFRVRDGVDSGNLTLQAQQFLQIYDGDQNDYLEMDEMPEQAMGIDFEAADKDQDGKLYLAEIETALSLRNWVQQCQIRFQGLEGDDPLLRVIDSNGDRRLAARELLHVDQRLTDLDANDSRDIEFPEIPASLVFEFFRGNDGNGNIILAPATISVANSVTESGPRWFQGMDYNADGDISPREFLGTPDQFALIDTDGDGFLTVAEAAAALPSQ